MLILNNTRLQPVLGKFGKIQRINHAVFVKVFLIERFAFAADNNTVGSLNWPFANHHAGKKM
jgi:hypothetical protein